MWRWGKEEERRMKRLKLGAMVAVCGLLLGSMTASAASKEFYFSITKGNYDTHDWIATKESGVQTAYITPTSIRGTGRIWAAVYGINGDGQYTIDVAIQPGQQGSRKESTYYKTGYVGTNYRLLGGDSEWEVTSATFDVTGNWTP